MITRLLMPKLGLTMTEGQIVSWLKVEGETVSQGDPLMEVLTDKVTTEVESPGTGILRKILVEEGVEVPCGTLVGILADAGEDISSVMTELEGASGAKMAVGEAEPATPTSVAPVGVQASPAVRRLAKELGVDLTGVKPSGAGNRITEDDVKIAVAMRAEAAVPSSSLVPLEGMRRVIAEGMAKSSRETARVTLISEVRLDRAKTLKDSLAQTVKEKAGVSLSYTDFAILAAARALKIHPDANCYFLDDRIEMKPDINVGIAVNVPGGLVVPVLENADRCGLAEIARERARLVEGARAGSLPPDSYRGGSITVTNLGTFGVDFFTPIINLPESTIVGIGRIAERPVVDNGAVIPAVTMFISLVFDHRVIDGAPAAEFLKTITGILEEPGRLLA